MMRTREVDQFQWLPREQMVVLVYLITAMHSMQWGSIDKALKYTDKALTQIEKLSLIDSSPILTIFQLSTLEHIVMCRLVSGNKTNAVQVSFENKYLPFYETDVFLEFIGKKILDCEFSALSVWHHFIHLHLQRFTSCVFQVCNDNEIISMLL